MSKGDDLLFGIALAIAFAVLLAFAIAISSEADNRLERRIEALEQRDGR